MKKLPREEQETLINQTAQERIDGLWHVYSDDPTVMRKLDKIGVLVREEESGGRHYTLEQAQVSLSKKRKPMSEEQRLATAERFRIARAANVSGGKSSDAA